MSELLRFSSWLLNHFWTFSLPFLGIVSTENEIWQLFLFATGNV